MNAMRCAAAAALIAALAACSRGGGRPPVLLEPAAVDARGGEVFQAGVASWYGDDFHGRLTADGEVYDMHKLTAAHQNLPFHTLVEVENLENGRRVLVRINDRGPFVKERIIDLSLEAARRLDMVERGTAEVRLRVLRWGGPGQTGAGARPEGEGAAAAAPGPGASGRFCVQAGAFSVRENAEDLLRTLKQVLPGLAFRVQPEDGLFKVLSAELDDASCRDAIRVLAEHRLPGFIRDPGSPD